MCVTACLCAHLKATQHCTSTVAVARSLQLGPALCNPLDCSPPASSVRGGLQARTLEWVAMPSSGDLPNPGTEPASLNISCIGVDRQALYH